MEHPDNAEKGIRFGCGFVFGIVLGGIAALRVFYDEGNSAVVMAVVIALIFGFIALRFGDSFWRWYARWFNWYR